jgi:anti-sigma factor RsiW
MKVMNMPRCRDIAKELSEYLDGELDSETCAEIEAHMAGCKNCRLMVDTMRRTVTLCREGVEEELPNSIKRKLDKKMEEKWKKKFGRE